MDICLVLFSLFLVPFLFQMADDGVAFRVTSIARLGSAHILLQPSVRSLALKFAAITVAALFAVVGAMAIARILASETAKFFLWAWSVSGAFVDVVEPFLSLFPIYLSYPIFTSSALTLLLLYRVIHNKENKLF